MPEGVVGPGVRHGDSKTSVTPNAPQVLILTIGTGTEGRREETLYSPLRKSIETGSWSSVVLLPSHVSESFARELCDALQPLPVRVYPLPQAGCEDDADQCFAHFDSVISSIVGERISPSSLVVDFTRGTKAMSAALVLAAVRREIPTLRYIVGQRDERGMVLPGHEEIREVLTLRATAARSMDTVYAFLLQGEFAGAIMILDAVSRSSEALVDSQSAGMKEEIRAVRAIAEFYAAWDRLDYVTAEKLFIECVTTDDHRWHPLMPDAEMHDWVKNLARPLPHDYDETAAQLRRLAVDLLANGERRIRDHHYEDAVLRAYRILELIGQIRLFDHGLDTSDIDPEHYAVRKVPKLRSKSKTSDLVKAGRAEAVELLVAMNDPMGRMLKNMANASIITAESRNTSVLVHGFTAVSAATETSLQRHYKSLEELVREDNRDAKEYLCVARKADLGSRLQST